MSYIGTYDGRGVTGDRPRRSARVRTKRARGQSRDHRTAESTEKQIISTITTNDGTQIYFKDWGPKNAQPIVFHHGWPLSADDWDAQMLFFLSKGYRVVAHDRRGNGRSSPVAGGYDMDH